MESNTDLYFEEDSIEPCRTCGIYFTIGLDMDQKLVKPLFDSDDAASPTGMAEILEQMSAWQMQVARDDGRPQYMCISCIAEFQKLLKFKRSCLETQEQFEELELQREHNGVVIKREIEAEPDEKFCGFVYLDISDEEDISDEDGSRRVSAAFDIPHVPIKEEHMARVPVQNKATFLPPEPKELGSPIESNFREMEHEELTGMFSASSADANTLANSDDDEEEEEEDEAIIKFTYDDDDEAAATLPQPIVETPAIVSCKLCSYDSPNEEAHLEHMQRMHLLKDWECHICAKKFISAPESRLKFHMKWHKLQRHLKCPMCGFFCSSKETLKDHKKAVHTRTKCTFCGKNIRTNLLQRHLKTHLKDRQADLVDQMNLLQDPQVDAVTSSPPVVPTVTVTTASQEPVSPAKPPPPVAPTTPEKEDSCVSATTEGIPADKDLAFTLEPPGQLDSPNQASVNDICVVQCAFCSDTFDDTVQLGAHVLATHKRPTKRLHSPDKTPPPVQPAKVRKPGIEKNLPPVTPVEETSTEDDNMADESLNGSSQSTEQQPQYEDNKAYSRCPLCHKTFNLKFKLNRHMAQHKPPF